MRKVFISGMGVQSSNGNTIAHFDESLRTGQSNYEQYHEVVDDLDIQTVYAPLLDFSYTQRIQQFDKMPKNILDNGLSFGLRAPLPIQTSILTALEAWQMAKLHETKPNSERMGIVVASDQTLQMYQYQSTLKFKSKPHFLSPKYPIHALETDHVGTLSELLSIHGQGFAISGASASGNVALIKAMEMVQYGKLDVCLVVGALSELSPMAIQGMINIGAIGGKNFYQTPEYACRPFDEQREGFIYGQGAGCIILESCASLENRKHQAATELMSGALMLDGNKSTQPDKHAEAKVMENCLKQVDVMPHQIDYVNTHGTSSVLGDIAEIAAIHEVFGEQADKQWVNSTKSLVGHCLFSAGIIEAIACILQMQGGYIHGNKNLCKPIAKMPYLTADYQEGLNIQMALSNSFGFGGINSSILLKKND